MSAGISPYQFSLPPILSLREVFPEIFDEKSHICNVTLRQLISVQDSYNGSGAYVFDDTLLGDGCSATYERSADLADYVLYNRTSGSSAFIPVDSINAKYFDSGELYLKKISSVPSDGDYVSIYGLVKLDESQIFSRDSTGLSPYLQLAFRVAAVTYAIGCIQMRMIVIYMRDIARLNAEAEAVNQAFGTLSKIKQQLCAFDSQIYTDDSERAAVDVLNTASISAKIFSFFARRDLLDESLLAGTITDTNAINSLCDEYKAYHDALVKADLTDASSPVAAFTPNLFKAWTQFSTLVRHYGLFFGITPPVDSPTTVEQREKIADVVVRNGLRRDVLFRKVWGNGTEVMDNTIADCWNQFIKNCEMNHLLESANCCIRKSAIARGTLGNDSPFWAAVGVRPNEDEWRQIYDLYDAIIARCGGEQDVSSEDYVLYCRKIFAIAANHCAEKSDTIEASDTALHEYIS
ncbi:MAG: hypothetical protein LBH53_02870, partial [Puniceicoccales bacterium]|nr:hypothetical protein [Puniceicoccales bacterium]